MIKFITSDLFVNISCLILGTLIGYISKLLSEKRKKSAERFTKLYAPFIKLHMTKVHGAHFFSDFDSELQSKFISIILDNYEYTDSMLRKYFYEFKCAYHSNDSEGLNQTFIVLLNYMDEQFKILSKKLFYNPRKIRHIFNKPLF